MEFFFPLFKHKSLYLQDNKSLAKDTYIKFYDKIKQLNKGKRDANAKVKY